MTPEELPSGKNSKPLDAELRKDLLKSLTLAFPTLLIGMSVGWLKDRIGHQPGQALWIVIPGLVLLSLIFVRTTTRQKLKLGWPFLVFLPVYILVFFFAATSNLLDWKRSLTGYDKAVPRNFLALNRFGDWHYRFAPEEPPDNDLAIVLVKPPESVEAGRFQIQDLLAMAQAHQAKAVALDFYFQDYAEDIGVDESLCGEIENAKAAGMPVLVTYNFQLKYGSPTRIQIDPDLEKCLPLSAQGHVMGYAESDGKVRSIPLYFGNNRQLESLSLKIAKILNPQSQPPANGLLQFLKPAKQFPMIAFEDLDQGSDEDQAILRDRIIVVGEDSPQDSFPTAYGVLPGAVIHAYAIHSLRHNHFIERASWWISLLMISLLCYLMMVLTARGVGNVKLVVINLAFSVLIVGIAILAMYLWLTWIDLVYPLLATWLFLLLLIALRTIGFKKMPLESG
jgi:CHASE2 domain-containing sensor protein